MNQLSMINKTQLVEKCNQTIQQQLRCVLQSLRLDETCDVITLQRILREQFDGFVVDPVEPTRKWWTTFIVMPEFRTSEVTFKLFKDEQGVYCVEIVAKREAVTEFDTKCEVRRVIRLPIDLQYEKIRVLFTQDKCLLVKVPFQFTEEQRYIWLNRVLDTCMPYKTTLDCCQDGLATSNDIVRCTVNDLKITQQLLNGWGPIITQEMRQIEVEITQLLPLLKPFNMLPTFWKDSNSKQHKIIVDFFLPMIVRAEELKVQTMQNERKIAFEINVERKQLDGRIESHYQTRRVFAVPQQVQFDKVESKLLPNGQLRLTMPIALKEKIIPFDGEVINVKH